MGNAFLPALQRADPISDVTVTFIYRYLVKVWHFCIHILMNFGLIKADYCVLPRQGSSKTIIKIGWYLFLILHLLMNRYIYPALCQHTLGHPSSSLVCKQCKVTPTPPPSPPYLPTYITLYEDWRRKQNNTGLAWYSALRTTTTSM